LTGKVGRKPSALKAETRAKLEQMQKEAFEFANALNDVLDGKITQATMGDQLTGNKLLVNEIKQSKNTSQYFITTRAKLTKDEKIEILLEAQTPMEKLIREVYRIKDDVLLEMDEHDEQVILSVMDEKFTDKEKLAVFMRYGLGEYTETHTYKQIGKELGVTSGRVGQIVWRAIMKLRYKKPIMNAIFDGIPMEVETLRQQLSNVSLEEYKLQKADLQDRINAIKNGDLPDGYSKQVENILLEDLDLSLRSYNVLKRQGLNTIADVYDYFQVQKVNIFDLKNMGTKSAREIQSKLAEYGVVIDWPQKGTGNIVPRKTMYVGGTRGAK
jgi:hypothetical protein